MPVTTTSNARSSTYPNKHPPTSSNAGEYTDPIAKIAKLAHPEDKDEGDNEDNDGAATATGCGHDGYVKEEEDPPLETDSIVPPPLGATKVGDSQDIDEIMPPGADNNMTTTTSAAASASYNKKSRKDRKEFTAAEKLLIISEIQAAPSLQSVLDKYGVSKSSLHRWRQPEKMEQLQEMVNGVGPDVVMVDEENDVKGGDTTHSNPSVSSSSSVENKDMYRKRVMNDKLRQIKLGLWEFCKNNMNRDENERLAITSSLIKHKAMQIKEDLLSRHYASQSTEDFLSDEEVAALKSFLASKSWACQIGNHLGYLSSGASIQWTDQAKANTAAYLEEHSRDPPKPKKQRMEFTAEEKLAIVRELEETNVQNKAQRKPAITVEEMCRKYDTSKSSVHRWQQQYRSGRLQELATTTSGYSNSKRIFTCRLNVVKQDLNNFYLENENASLDNKIAMTFSTLQSRALATKESLLERHYATVAARGQEAIAKQEDGEGIESIDEQQHMQQQQPEKEVAKEEIITTEDENGSNSNIDVMCEEEVNALVNFKASNSWLREVAKKFGWKLDLEKRDTLSRSTMVDHEEGMEKYILVAQEE